MTTLVKKLYNRLKYDNMPKTIKELVECDFKNQCLRKGVKDEPEDSLWTFIKYKRYGGSFDCDRCKLANSIYRTLWGWTPKKRSPNAIEDSLKQAWEELGTNSDTMNSFATTFRRALAKSESSYLREYTNAWYSTIDNQYANTKIYERLCKDYPQIKDFAKYTHTIGNFTLIPFKLRAEDSNGFNACRGYSKIPNNKYFVCDYWDLSLQLIKDAAPNPELFEDYINSFYLFDYVNSDGIISLFDRHREYINKNEFKPLEENAENFLPNSIGELNQYIERVVEIIRDRGTLMVIILMLKKLKEKE